MAKNMICGGLIVVVAPLLMSGCASFPNDFPPESSVPPVTTEFMAGDEVEITFLGAPDLNTIQTVRRDGGIMLKLLGDVVVAGKTPKQLRADLMKRYESQLQIKEVSVVLRTHGPIFVGGAVMQPGRVELNSPLTVLDAIMLSGGFDEEWAEVRKVLVIRNEGGTYRTFTVNFGTLLENGGEQKAFYLKPFDMIYVSRFSAPRTHQWGNSRANKTGTW